MDPRLLTALALTTGITAVLATLLVVIKLTHHAVEQWRGVRAAQYLAAVGEMVSRGMMPAAPSPGWAGDPLFHAAVVDYRFVLTGQDRRFIDDLVTSLGVGDVLVARARRRFPVASRLRAVSSLVSLATSDHLGVLRAMLDDPNPHVRVNVVRGLAQLGDAESVPSILDLASLAKAWEAARIADALVGMGPAAVDPILTFIADESRRPDPAVAVVALSARVLGLIGDPAAEPALVNLLASGRSE